MQGETRAGLECVCICVCIVLRRPEVGGSLVRQTECVRLFMCVHARVKALLTTLHKPAAALNILGHDLIG